MVIGEGSVIQTDTSNPERHVNRVVSSGPIIYPVDIDPLDDAILDKENGVEPPPAPAPPSNPGRRVVQQ
jgi:hypothetical protein